MSILLLAVGVVVVFIILLAILGSGPREMDKEAADEAAHETTEELREATTPEPETLEEREKENVRQAYEDK